MGSEANLKSWISDKLMSLLGYSQPTVVQYVIGLTKQASSPADVVGTLVEFGLSSSGETRAFAKEIARVPRKSGGVNSEEEQFRDQREREELERHIRKWDAARTQKLTEPKMSKEEEEEAIRRSNALEKDDLEALRKVSRQEYLKKREKKKLEELRDEIEDEQYLFEGVELTEAECRELRYKKEIYELVTKRWTEDAGEISEVISSIEQVSRKGAKKGEKKEEKKQQGDARPKKGHGCVPPTRPPARCFVAQRDSF